MSDTELDTFVEDIVGETGWPRYGLDLELSEDMLLTEFHRVRAERPRPAP